MPGFWNRPKVLNEERMVRTPFPPGTKTVYIDQYGNENGSIRWSAIAHIFGCWPAVVLILSFIGYLFLQGLTFVLELIGVQVVAG